MRHLTYDHPVELCTLTPITHSTRRLAMSHHQHKQQTEVETLTKALSAPFELTEVKFKPAVVSGNRAMALAYVDARVIQDRLDDVLGVDGWQDEYECLPDGRS